MYRFCAMVISNFGTHRKVEDLLHWTQEVKLLRSRTDLISRELVRYSERINKHNRTPLTVDVVVRGISTDLNTTVYQQNALSTKGDSIHSQRIGLKPRWPVLEPS